MIWRNQEDTAKAKHNAVPSDDPMRLLGVAVAGLSSLARLHASLDRITRELAEHSANARHDKVLIDLVSLVRRQTGRALAVAQCAHLDLVNRQKPEVVDLLEVVDDALDQHAPLLDHAQVELDAALEAVPGVVGVRGHLLQGIHCMIREAVNGARLVGGCRFVSVRLNRTTRGSVQFETQHDGAGLSAEGGSPDSGAAADLIGAAFGLVQCRAAAEESGGQLTCRVDPTGFTMTLSLPAATIG
jgi:hypothetical protein